MAWQSHAPGGSVVIRMVLGAWLCAGACLAGASTRPASAADAEYVFPDDANIVNVQRDFGAKGDGVTDDTAALLAAVKSVLGEGRYTPKFIYLPNGVYLVSDTIWNRVGEGGWDDGWRVAMILIGQSRTKTIIKLKDRCEGYADAAKPKPVLMYGSEMHGKKQFDKRPTGYGNSAFRNAAINLTVDVGTGNPGAIGIDFLASNKGAVRQVTIRSSDPARAGHTGLSQVRPWPGPGLIKDVEIIGFDYGLRQRSMDCSMTYQGITLREQRKLAIEGLDHPTMSMRGVRSENAVPFLQVSGKGAIIMLIDSACAWTGKGQAPPAITNEGNLMLKNVTVAGYGQAVVNKGKGLLEAPPVTGNPTTIEQYFSKPPTRLLGASDKLPNLPVKDAPTWNCPDLSKWANPRKFAANSKTAGIQEAIDSGAEVVYLPNGSYSISEPIVLRGKLKVLLGLEATISAAKGVAVDPYIRYDGGEADAVMVEHIKLHSPRVEGGMKASGRVIEHNCGKALVVRHCESGYRNTAKGVGDAFFEDNMLGHPRIHHPQNVWAWQLNSEFGDEPQFINNGGNVWILGMKTEGNTELVVNNKGVMEVYALYDMTTSQPKDTTAMVVNNEGRLAASFADGGQKFHKTKISETLNGQTKTAGGPRETMMFIGGQ